MATETAAERDCRRFQEKVPRALEQSAREESQPLDVEALKQHVRARLAAVGITD